MWTPVLSSLLSFSQLLRSGTKAVWLLVQWCWSPLARVMHPAVQPCQLALCWSGGPTPCLIGTTNCSGSLMMSSSKALSTWSAPCRTLSYALKCMLDCPLQQLQLQCRCNMDVTATPLFCCFWALALADMDSSHHSHHVLISLHAAYSPVLLDLSYGAVCCYDLDPQAQTIQHSDKARQGTGAVHHPCQLAPGCTWLVTWSVNV